jgi:hypothetical protein
MGGVEPGKWAVRHEAVKTFGTNGSSGKLRGGGTRRTGTHRALASACSWRRAAPAARRGTLRLSRASGAARHPAAGVARVASAGPPSAPRSPARPRACSHHPRSPQLRLTGPSSAALFGRTPAAGTPRPPPLLLTAIAINPHVGGATTVTRREPSLRRTATSLRAGPEHVRATGRRGSPPRRRRPAAERARRRPNEVVWSGRGGDGRPMRCWAAGWSRRAG